MHLLRYHDVLAPHAGWRRGVVGFGRPPRSREELTRCAGGTARLPQSRYWAWAALMRRAFGLDVLACPRCGGRLRLIAALEDPAVVAKIRAHLDRRRPAAPPGPAPCARARRRRALGPVTPRPAPGSASARGRGC